MIIIVNNSVDEWKAAKLCIKYSNDCGFNLLMTAKKTKCWKVNTANVAFTYRLLS